MLPVESWAVFYADGSTFTSAQGSWADAPRFGVQCVVYYHDDGRITRDTSSQDESLYVWRGEGEQADIKIGLWMDEAGHYRIVNAAGRSLP